MTRIANMSKEMDKMSNKDRMRMLKKQKKMKSAGANLCRATIVFLLDMLMNLIYTVMINLQVVFFNYFGGIFVIFVQMLGFYYTGL